MSQYINSFTITVVCMIILSYILRSIMPVGNIGKYINFIIGLIVSITIFSAFANTDEIDFGDTFALAESETMTKEEANIIYNERIAERTKENIKNKVCDIVFEHTNENAECDVLLEVDTDGKIVGITGIYIKNDNYNNVDKIKSKIAKEFGIDDSFVHIGGMDSD